MKHRPIFFIILILSFTLFSQEYVKDRVNVKFKTAPSREQLALLSNQLNLEKLSEVEELNLVVFRIQGGEDVESVIQKLGAYNFVEYAEPEYIYKMENTPTGSPDTQTTENQVTKRQPFAVADTVEFMPGELLVKFKEIVRTEQLVVLADKINAQVIGQLRPLNIYHLRVAKEVSLEQIIRDLKLEPDVEYAEPNYIYYALEIPNDPLFSQLWGLNNEGQTGGTFDADIDAPEAWNVEKGKRDIIVSVIDTGVDYTHPDLAANMWVNSDEIAGNGLDDDNNGYVDDYRGWDFVNNDNNPNDDNDHGTHCAGTIGAVGNNNRGVAGVNWRVSIMPLKFLTADGNGSSSDAIKAIIYAVDNGAQLLSNSWGGYGRSEALNDAIEYASSRGVLFIAAAGNENNDNDVKPHYPSSYESEDIIAVAASDDRDMLATFSNYGPTTVDLAAPGVEVLSTIIGNRYDYFSGTSMATPHVAGAAALVWAHFYPDVNQDVVKYRLFGAVDYVTKLQDWLLFEGRLNLHTAFREIPLVAVVKKPTNTDDELGPYTVQVSVVDDDTVTSVKLFYRISDGATRQDTVQMVSFKPYLFLANIPGSSKGSKVEYKIYARDTDNNVTESRFYSFIIGKKPSGGCCGSFAATIHTGHPQRDGVLSAMINLLLFFGPPILIKWRIKKCNCSGS